MADQNDGGVSEYILNGTSAGLVAFYDTRPVVVSKVGLFYNAPKPTQGNRVMGHPPSDASSYNPWNCRRSSCFFWRKP